jgi:hypothetical protein
MKFPKYQLAHAYDHRNNLAKRAIQTFKAHFISVLNGTDESFPPHFWCRLIPQTVLTLNMLRRSRINPKLSAPLAPMGTKVIVYERKKQRLSTWSDHSQHGWYTGSAPHHYRNYSVFITATRAIRVCDTVVFLPTKFPMPATSSADRVTKALENLVTELRNPRPAAPFLTEGSPTQHAINTLETFFQNRLLTTTSRPMIHLQGCRPSDQLQGYPLPRKIRKRLFTETHASKTATSFAPTLLRV